MANNPSFRDRTILDFRSRLVGGGARPNLFECVLSFPLELGITLDVDFRLMVKAATLPASTIAQIEVPFRGRRLKIAGDRTFDPWTITVINDTDFKIRNAFEQWMNYMNRHEDNAGVITPANYQTNMEVLQLGRGTTNTTNLPNLSDQMNVLKRYKFYGCFPTNVTPIDLAYDNNDAIEEFNVDLQYQWYDALDSEKTILGSSSDPGNTSENVNPQF